jgi:hypothetical protein
MLLVPLEMPPQWLVTQLLLPLETPPQRLATQLLLPLEMPPQRLAMQLLLPRTLRRPRPTELRPQRNMARARARARPPRMEALLVVFWPN